MHGNRPPLLKMASRLATWTILLPIFAGMTEAAPSISFPINSQVPPVARIGRPFSFVFSLSTFSSTSPISYSLASPPSWLSIDGLTRRLYGTPSEKDIGPGQVVGVPVNLVAADSSGSTTLVATLVVSRSPGPRLNVPLERQVPQFGVFSAPCSISAPPQLQFSFNLATDTFLDPSASLLNYYTVMADNTPLPAWISFDASKLSFSGRTPPAESLIQTPQRFSMQVVASDVVGFAAASLQFDIVVGNHEITADQTTISINATVGSPVSYTGLRESVKVEGKPATANNAVIVSTPGIPPWLSVDRNTWYINGVPPEGAKSTTFTIIIQDKSSDSLNFIVSIAVAGEVAHSPDNLFRADMPALTATAGEHFSFELGTYLANPQDTDVSIISDASTPWAQLDAKSLTISGEVPGDLRGSVGSIGIQAKSKTSGKTERIFLTMHILARGETTMSPSRPPSVAKQTTIPTSITESAAPPDDGSLASVTGNDGSSQPNLLLLAVLLPVFIAIVSVTCLLFWCFRRRQERKRSRLTTRDISGPLPGTFVINQTGPFGSHAYGSAKELRAQFDNPHSGHDPFADEQKGYLEAQSSYASSIAGVSRPLATVRLLPPIKGSPSDGTDDDVFGTGRVPLLLAVPPQVGPLRLGRYEGLSNGRSLGSISETSIYDEQTPKHTQSTLPPALSLGRHGAGTPFRDAVEVHIPTLHQVSSVTQTPESAYTMSRRRSLSPHSYGVSGSDRFEGHQPLRAQSRLGHHPRPTRKFAWPWLRDAFSKTNAARVARGAKEHARKLSAATVDTFAYRKTPSGPAPGPALRNSIAAQPSPLHHTVPSPDDIDCDHSPPSTRPVTRRGPAPGQPFTGAFPGSLPPVARTTTSSLTTATTATKHPDPALPSSPTMGYGTTLPLVSPAAKMTGPPVIPGRTSSQQRAPPPDSLGITTPVHHGVVSSSNNNYDDLVGAGPFHQSRTWSSAGGAGEGAGGGGGDEWCDETVRSLQSLLSQSLSQSLSQTSVSQPNWTAVGGGISTTGTGRLLALSRSGEEEELGSELLSPERWPRPAAGRSGNGSGSGSGSGFRGVARKRVGGSVGEGSQGGKEGKGGEVMHSLSQASSLVSDGSKRYI